MARKGWLGRISRDLLGDTLVAAIDIYYDLEGGINGTDKLVRRYLAIAPATCLELLCRQVGQHGFDPERHMHTPVDLRITAADLPELARIIPRPSPPALHWLDRKAQSVGDIMSVQDEAGAESVFKGDPELLDGTHMLYGVRNDYVHGRGPRRYDRRLVLWVVRRHLEKNLAQMPPLLAIFMLVGVDRAMERGDEDAAVDLYQKIVAEEKAEAEASGVDTSTLRVIAGKAAEIFGRDDEAAGWYGKAIEADPGNANAHAAMTCILARMGRNRDALAAYDKAAEIDPPYVNAHMGRGSILWHLGRHADALECYRRAAEADPPSIGSRTEAGMPDDVRDDLTSSIYAHDAAVDPAGWCARRRGHRRGCASCAPAECFGAQDGCDRARGWTGREERSRRAACRRPRRGLGEPLPMKRFKATAARRCVDRYMLHLVNTGYGPADARRIVHRARFLASELGASVRVARVATAFVELDISVDPARLDALVKRLGPIGPLDNARNVSEAEAAAARPSKEDGMREGIEYFNGERFWEAHEAWEGAWKQCEGAEKLLVQGIILVAVAFAHSQKNDTGVGINMFGRALEKIGGHTGRYHGIDVDAVRERVAAMRRSGEMALFQI